MNDTYITLEVAKRYIDGHQTQQKIAHDLNITQPEVSEIIKQARREGIIKQTIQTPLEAGLSQKIKDKFKHIHECIVIRYRGDHRDESNALVIDELGKVAADHFNRHVMSESLLGVSGGLTLASMVNHLTEDSNIRNLKVYSLSIWCRSRIYAVSPVAIVSNIIKKYPGSIGYSAQLPDYSRDIAVATEQQQRDLERVKPILETLQKSNIAKTLYIGLGSIPGELHTDENVLWTQPTLDFSVLLKELQFPAKLLTVMAGECCFQPYDIEGKILTSEKDDIGGALQRLETNIIGFGLDNLQKMARDKSANICAVAGGFHKQRSILGGLRARIFNNLITDINCAEYIIENS